MLFLIQFYVRKKKKHRIVHYDFSDKMAYFSWFHVNLNTAWVTPSAPNAHLVPKVLGFKLFKMNAIVIVAAWYLFGGWFTCNYQAFLLIPLWTTETAT